MNKHRQVTRRFAGYRERFWIPVCRMMEEWKWLSAMYQGIMAGMPILIAASGFLLFERMVQGSLREYLQIFRFWNSIMRIVEISIGMMSVWTAFFTAYFYGKENSEEPALVGSTAVIGYLMLLPADGGELFHISAEQMGGSGLFLALACGLLTGKLYQKIGAIQWNKIFGERLSGLSAVGKSYLPSLAAAWIFLAFILLAAVFSLTPYGDAYHCFHELVQQPLTASAQNPWFYIILHMLMNLAWFFGVHGSGIYRLVFPVITAVNMANLAAYQAGMELPGIYASWILFFMAGGMANTLGLSVYLAGFARSKRYRRLGKISLLPSIFNINEPLAFGIPLVMNPSMLIPMLLNPIFCGMIAYVGLANGWVNPSSSVMVVWTMPRAAAALMCGGIRLMGLQLLTTAVAAGLYIPFFWRMDREALVEERDERFSLKHTNGNCAAQK